MNKDPKPIIKKCDNDNDVYPMKRMAKNISFDALGVEVLRIVDQKIIIVVIFFSDIVACSIVLYSIYL